MNAKSNQAQSAENSERRADIVEEDQLKATQPDFVVLFPWNLREELVDQLHYIREWGGRFVVAIPKLDIF